MTSLKVVSLLSAAYSGSTLLSILMNLHPDISSDGEIFPYIRGSKLLCSCGEYQIDCNYYRTVAGHFMAGFKQKYDINSFYYIPKFSSFRYLSRAMEGFWVNSFINRFRNTLTSKISKYKDLQQTFAIKHLELMENSLRLRNASIYFDGTKSLRRAEFFLERNLIFRMIHLIRDGRAFCYSFLKNNSLPKSSIPIAAKLWNRAITKVDTLNRRFPHVKMLDVRYNDLCSDPETELKKICEFLQVPFDVQLFDYCKEDMHLIGNRMRFKFTGEIMEDLSWKVNLNDKDISNINKLVKHNLRRFNFINV